MKNNKAVTLIVLTSFLFILILSSCQGGAAGELKIAILAPMSGPVPAFGVSTRDGALLAIEEANAKGGVLGKKIVAVVEDSQCMPDPAVNAINKVIEQDKVHFMIGEVCSSASIPMSEVAEMNKVVMISPTSTNPTVTLNGDGSTKQFVFRACFIDPFQGTVMAKFALSKGYKTAFIMFDQGNDYVRGLAEFFEKAFVDAGGEVVGKEAYTKTDTDFSAVLAKVAESKADVLFVPDYYNIINLVSAQAKEKGVTAVMMGGDGWSSDQLDLKAADGGFYSDHYSPEDTRPVVQRWVTNYKEKYNSVPDVLAALGYDATNLMIAAIAKAGTDDTIKVAAALANIKYAGVTGTITFDPLHNPIKDAAVISIKDGKKAFAASIASNSSDNVQTAPIENNPEDNSGDTLISNLTQIKNDLLELQNNINILPSSQDVQDLKKDLDGLNERISSMERLINENPEKAVSEYKINTDIQVLQDKLENVTTLLNILIGAFVASVLGYLFLQFQKNQPGHANVDSVSKPKSTRHSKEKDE